MVHDFCSLKFPEISPCPGGAPHATFRGELFMAGPGINPVQVFWTLKDFVWEFLRHGTGSELPSSCVNLPCYASIRNRNSLDFMRWSDFDHGAQDLKES